MNKYILVLLISLFLFVIFLITYIRKRRNANPDEKLYTLLLDTSLFFDVINDKIKECTFTKESIQPFKDTAKKLLQKIYNIGYFNSNILLINQNDCIHFNNKKVENCNKENITLCKHCKDIWRQINTQLGIRLKNNLIQTYDEKGNLFLYKTYECKNSLRAIGITLQI